VKPPSDGYASGTNVDRTV